MATASTATAAMAAMCSTSNSDSRWQKRCTRGGRSFPFDTVQPPSHHTREGSVPSVDSKSKSRRSLLASALPPLFRNVSPSSFGQAKQLREVSESDICYSDSHLNDAVLDLEESMEDGNGSVLKELIPLHAELLAEKREKRERRWNVSVPGLPIESALRSVDAVASDIARLVLSRPQVGMLPPFYWPFFGRGASNQDGFGDVEINEVMLLEEVDQEVEGGELQEMETDDLMALESLLQPRCAWPRSILSPPPEATTPALPHSSTNAPMNARCAWPRQPFTASTPQDSPSSSSNLRNPLLASSPPLGPRCAWPRSSAVNSSAAATSPLAPSSPSPSVPAGEDLESFERMYAAPSAIPAADNCTSQSHVPGPRCAWPRGSSSAVSSSPVPLAPRCAWPRQVSRSQAPVPEPLQTISPLVLEQLQPTPLGPHCMWPRSAGRVAATTPPVVPAVDEQAMSPAQQVFGPRCAWPRQSSTPSAAAAVGVAPVPAPAPVAEVAGWFDVPAAVAARTGGSLATFVPHSEPVPMGPRCTWPRTSRPAAPEVAMGPRCAWPRVAKQGGGESLQEVVASLAEAENLQQQQQVDQRASLSEAMKTLRGLSAGVGVAAGPPQLVAAPSQLSEAFAGPRCAWPRSAGRLSQDVVGGVPAASLAEVATPAVAEVAMGPRCSWPRNGVQPVIEKKLLFSVAQEVERDQESVVAGPRCAWPRKAMVAQLPTVEAVAGGNLREEEVVLGPRCAWPRGGKVDGTAIRAGGGGSPAKEGALNGGVLGGKKEEGELPVVVGRGRRGGLAELLASGVNGSEIVGERMRGRSLTPKREKVGAAWPRRVLGTSFCIGLLNQVLLSQNSGFALASPLDFIELNGDGSEMANSSDGFSIALRPASTKTTSDDSAAIVKDLITVYSRL